MIKHSVLHQSNQSKLLTPIMIIRYVCRKNYGCSGYRADLLILNRWILRIEIFLFTSIKSNSVGGWVCPGDKIIHFDQKVSIGQIPRDSQWEERNTNNKWVRVQDISEEGFGEVVASMQQWCWWEGGNRKGRRRCGKNMSLLQQSRLGQGDRPAARIEERNPGSGFCRLAGERERRSSWAVRVGSGPCFQLVDGGWSGLTGLQLTGVVSGRVVGGSRPVRPELTIVCNHPASAPPPPTTRWSPAAVKVRREGRGRGGWWWRRWSWGSEGGSRWEGGGRRLPGPVESSLPRQVGGAPRVRVGFLQFSTIEHLLWLHECYLSEIEESLWGRQQWTQTGLCWRGRSGSEHWIWEQSREQIHKKETTKWNWWRAVPENHSVYLSTMPSSNERLSKCSHSSISMCQKVSPLKWFTVSAPPLPPSAITQAG